MAVGSARRSSLTNPQKYSRMSTDFSDKVIHYLVIAGGGAGGNQGQFGIDRGGGGGGAGGYRSSMPLQFSGGSSQPESPLPLRATPTSYALTVGAGSGNSTFGTIVSLAGGRGGNSYQNGSSGGSGGGGGGGQGSGAVGGAGTAGQGSNGENANGFGGGSGQTSSGVGLYFIQNGSITRLANGGQGNAGNPGAAGAANTGNGGAGGGDNNGWGVGGAGGSGVIFIMVPTGTPVTFSGGVTSNNFAYGTNTVYRVTAAGVSDTVTIG